MHHLIRVIATRNWGEVRPLSAQQLDEAFGYE
jgi:hypothetical protein